jgi:hypothetical protein
LNAVEEQQNFNLPAGGKKWFFGSFIRSVEAPKPHFHINHVMRNTS